MRVLYVLDEQPGGGAPRSMIEMVLYLREHYGVLPICVAARESKFVDTLRSAGVEVIVTPYGSFMQSRPYAAWKIPAKYVLGYVKWRALADRAARLVESAVDFSSINLIHSNINRIDLGADLARRNCRPHIQHIREFGDLDFGCWSYVREPGRYISRRSTRVIAISDAVRDYWVSKKGLDLAKVRRVYNGVDFSHFVPKMNRLDNLVKFVMVGNILEGKGQLDVVRAFFLMPKDLRSRARLDIFGTGAQEYIEAIEKAVDDNELNGLVRLMGQSDDIPEVLSGYDVGIVASRAEGFGRVTVEYMAAGLAVIASDTGANRELLTASDGDVGLFFNFGDLDGLAIHMTNLVLNAALRREMSARGLLRAGDFTVENNAASVFEVYRSALEVFADGGGGNDI